MMNVAATFLAITEEQLVKYFKSNGAISPSTAITLNVEDLKANLETPEFLQSNLLSYNFIKATPSGKYYLDQQKYLQNTKLVKMLIILMFLIILISIVIKSLI